jgi:putative addiction module component (TIGR02574 family)
VAVLSVAEILELDIEDRLLLVHAIWDTIAEAPELFPVTDAERIELDRRLADLAAHPESSVPWSEARARLRRRR